MFMTVLKAPKHHVSSRGNYEISCSFFMGGGLNHKWSALNRSIGVKEIQIVFYMIIQTTLVLVVENNDNTTFIVSNASSCVNSHDKGLPTA